MDIIKRFEEQFEKERHLCRGYYDVDQMKAGFVKFLKDNVIEPADEFDFIKTYSKRSWLEGYEYGRFIGIFYSLIVLMFVVGLWLL